MKTKMIAMVAFVCSLIGGTQMVHAETAGIDTVFNLLKGLWYHEFNVNGYSGAKVLVFNSDSAIFQRIPNTDSVYLKEYNDGLVKQSETFLLTYEVSGNTHDYEWMLKNISSRFYLTFRNNVLWMNFDANDGGQRYYSRSSSATGITHSMQAGGKMILIQHPSTSHFSVAGLPSIDRLIISDLYGRTLRKITQVKVDEAIDISGLSTGIYLIKVYAGKESHSGKIIKK